MRRVVRSVSSNVELPELPEARIEIRNEMDELSAPLARADEDDGKVTRRRQRENETIEKNAAHRE